MTGKDETETEQGLRSGGAAWSGAGLDFRFLFEQSSDGMLLADAQSRRFLLANPEIQRMLGYTEAELLQLSVSDIHPATDLPYVLEQFQKQVRREITLTSELAVLRKDGTVFYADISTLPVRAQGHDLIFGFFRDVTERKLAAEALHRSELRFSYLVANTPAILFTCRPGGSYEITFVSENVTSLLGFSPQEFIADPDFWKKHIHPADVKRALSEEGKTLQGHEPHAVEYRFRRKDGTYCWLHDEMRMVRDESGQPLEMSGFWLDITARKRAEEEQATLEAQNRQLQKSESLGRMAGAIAHHYNNQLQVVLGNIELALDNLPRVSPARDNLAAATQAARRAADVSTQMLAYLGQSSGAKKPLDLSAVCRQSIPLILSTQPVVLITDFATPGPVINANANQVHQVLLNLVTNAWEAVGPNRGAIRVSVKTVDAAGITNSSRYPVDWQPEAGAYACLEVEDGGCGIAAADLDKIFDPFFSRKFVGRGLGLAVVLGIARAHNAGITVESEEGIGSKFRVYFPLVAHSVAPAPAGSAGPAPHLQASGTVLVVDDTEGVLELAAHAIRSMGFNVLTARDGVEALEVYRQNQADIRCVLCDLTMPRMNGWETIAALRQLTPGIRVILASGYDEVGVLASQSTEQPQAFLSKPYDRRKLQTTLRHVPASGPD